MLKKEIHNDLGIIFEMDSLKESEKINYSEINQRYHFRIIEDKGEFIHRTIISFDKNGNQIEKTFYLEDLNDNELQNIEYDKENKIIRRIEFENYSNGETKNMHVYDDKDNLIHHDYFDEDYWE